MEGTIVVKFNDQMIFVSNVQFDLLKILNKKDQIIRDEIVEKTRYPRTTAYDNLLSLIKRGFVGKYPVTEEGKRGRPWVHFYLTDQGKALIKTIEADLNEF